MTAIVSLETVLLVVLVVLVVGLLRSHAEILRRLGPGGEQPPLASPDTAPAAARNGSAAAPPVVGETPDGDLITLSFDGHASVPTLLAFLTSGCSTCAGFWETLGEPRLPSGVQSVIVTKGAERERTARLRKLAPAGVPVVMSSQAWQDYAVPGAPYFVLVDRGVRGEGLATSWHALASLVSDAIEDEHEAHTRAGGAQRARTIDEKLAAAGIGPEHPSLYPAGGQREHD